MKRFLILLFFFEFSIYCGYSQADTSNIIKKSSITPNLDLPASFFIDTTYFFGFTAFHENDKLHLLARNSDDNYTGGLKAEFVTNTFKGFQRSKILNPFQWRSYLQTLSYGFTLFTPNNLASDKIILDDRPYASYVFFSVGAQFIEPQHLRKKLGYELFVGTMGKPMPGNFQKHIHRDRWFGNTSPVPMGWDYEIANGGTLAVNLNMNYDVRLDDIEKPSKFEFARFTWKNGLNLGQYIINTSQSIRINLFNTNYSVINPEGPLIPKIVSKEVVNRSGNNILKSTKTKPSTFGFTLYVEPKLTVVVQNATLTGKLLAKSSPHSISGLKPILAEYDAGAQLRVYFATLGYTLAGRSSEFRGQKKDFHNWGGLYVNLNHRF